MVNDSSSSTGGRTCPNCKSPIASGMKFCESCGAKVEQAPACEQCGAPLLPNAKFCESCGKLVAAQKAQPGSTIPPNPAIAEVKKTTPPPEQAGTAKEKVPDIKTPEKLKDSVKKTSEKAPSSRTQTLVIAGVVGLVILAALAYFVVLPMLSGSGTPGVGTSVPVFGASPTSAAAGSPAASATVSASFVPEPTQVPPATLLVTYEAARDPITGLVTVTFRGGTGQYGVSDVAIRLTRSDGQVLTQNFKPQQIGSFITLPGTLMTDRIEVVAHYYNGDKYRIIDQLFEYKKRNL